jgi:hypothetical protein
VELLDEELPPPPQALLERIRGKDGILCLLTERIDAQVMDTAGRSLR